jgi:outer membrane lipoprotein SlyB
MSTLKSFTRAAPAAALWLTLAALLSGCPGKGEEQKPAAQAPCADCGVITGITEVRRKGEVIGGVIGHQVGGGRGKDVATVAGAAGGAAAGHEIEKRSNSTTSYDISVRLENGSTRVVNLQTPGGLAVGDKVKVTGNSLSRQS